MLRNELEDIITEILPSRCYVSSYVDRIMELVAKYRPAEFTTIDRSHVFEMDCFCDHCGEDTLHSVFDAGHERSSHSDTKTCLSCKWVWSGMTGDYHPPVGDEG